MTTYLFDFTTDNATETICVPDCDERTAQLLKQAGEADTGDVVELPYVTLAAAPNSTAQTHVGVFRVSRISNVREVRS